MNMLEVWQEKLAWTTKGYIKNALVVFSIYIYAASFSFHDLHQQIAGLALYFYSPFWEQE